MALAKLIEMYYKKRGLAVPSFDNAMKFVQTELGEVYELDLDRSGTWVRNNPQDKTKFDKEKLAKELGDCIMMLMVAGMAEDVDPLDALIKKMCEKADWDYDTIHKLYR